MVSRVILCGGDAESMERIVTGATPATLLGMGFVAGIRGRLTQHPQNCEWKWKQPPKYEGTPPFFFFSTWQFYLLAKLISGRLPCSPSAEKLSPFFFRGEKPRASQMMLMRSIWCTQGTPPPIHWYPWVSPGFLVALTQSVFSCFINSIDITDTKQYALSNPPLVNCSYCSLMLVTWGFAKNSKPLNHQPLTIGWSILSWFEEVKGIWPLSGSAKVVHSQGRSNDPTRQACGVDTTGVWVWWKQAFAAMKLFILFDFWGFVWTKPPLNYNEIRRT